MSGRMDERTDGRMDGRKVVIEDKKKTREMRDGRWENGRRPECDWMG